MRLEMTSRMTEETESVEGQSDKCIQPMGEKLAVRGRMFCFSGENTRMTITVVNFDLTSWRNAVQV